MGRSFRPLPAVQARRRALLAGLPVMLVGGAYAAWRGSRGDQNVPTHERPMPPVALEAHQAEGIAISNDVGGNFPVPAGTADPAQAQAQGFGRPDDAVPVYTLRADPAMSQAVITRHGRGTTVGHVLNLSIGSPAKGDAEPVVAAMMLRLDLGPTLPTAPRTYRLDPANLVGDALVVATHVPESMPDAGPAKAFTKRQVFRIIGGSIMVRTAAAGEAMVAQVSVHAVTAVAAGGAGSPATGRIRLHSLSPISVPVVLELDGMARRAGT